MMCSMTMVALRLTSSYADDGDDAGTASPPSSPPSGFLKALAHRALRAAPSSLSTMSVAMTLLTTSCRKRLSSAWSV